MVRGCAVSKRYINVCNCDMFGVVNVYLDHLKFYQVLNNVIITVNSLELNVLRIQLQRPVHRLQSSIICCSKEQLEDMIIPKSFSLLTLSITYNFWANISINIITSNRYICRKRQILKFLGVKNHVVSFSLVIYTIEIRL